MSNEAPASPNTALRIILGLIGFPLASVASFMTLFGLWKLFAESFDAVGIILVGLFAGAAIAGLVMLIAAIRGWGRKQLVTNEAREREVLELARTHGGHLTLADIALATDLDLEGARAIMDSLQLHGVADLQISNLGQEVYVFSRFAEDGADHLTARSMLDPDEEVVFSEDGEARKAEEYTEVASQAVHKR